MLENTTQAISHGSELVGTILPTSVLEVVGYGLLFLLGTCLVSSAQTPALNEQYDWQFRLMAYMRTPILVFIVVPMSFLLNLYRSIRTWFWKVSRTPTRQDGKLHQERVQKVVDQLQAWHNNGRTQTLRTARPNWASMSTKLGSNKVSSHRIDVSHLNHILEIDEDNLTITCEPGVTMGMITSILVPKQLALECQVEMESLTIGGLSMGFGVETNGHRTGWFQESVLSFQVVTAQSPPQVLTVTKESNPDLFYTLPHSVGTLGFLTAVKVKLTRTKPYVHLKYICTRTARDLQVQMKQLSEQDPDKACTFLEATSYSQDTAVIQYGDFCDKPSTQETKKLYNPINYWFKPFYYKHLEAILDSGVDTYEEIVPLKHYYHRYTRSIFWEIEHMLPFANHPLYRFFWGWLGAPEVGLLKLFGGQVTRRNSVYAHVVQESTMPIDRFEEGLHKFEQWFGVYPLLIFPLRTFDRGNRSGFLHPQKRNLKDGTNWGMWLLVGAYGVPRSVQDGGTFDAKKTVREMEHWTREVGGWQSYYTDLFCTRKEYRAMFDHSLWDKARIKYDAHDAFPEPYDKVKSEPGIVDLSAEEAAEAKSAK